jgi:hypothetical protein
VPGGGAHKEILEWSGAKESGHIHEHITGMEQLADAVKELEEGAANDLGHVKWFQAPVSVHETFLAEQHVSSHVVAGPPKILFC